MGEVMDFIEWLRENYNYKGDGSTFDMQSIYSGPEIEYLYSKYESEYGDD
jgi:hypothetical protein